MMDLWISSIGMYVDDLWCKLTNSMEHSLSPEPDEDKVTIFSLACWCVGTALK